MAAIEQYFDVALFFMAYKVSSQSLINKKEKKNDQANLL